MTHRMLTIIGKVNSKEYQGDYRQANYCFDANHTETATYFGLALSKIIQPDEIIVLGTKGSMWDNLFMQIEDFVDDYPEDILTLTEQAQQDNVSEELLDKLANIAAKKLGISYRCELIPYAATENEQIQLIEQITELFNENDTATLDVTHGLRHLPLLIQQVAQLLPLIKKVSINGVYYGALDLTQDNKTPVMRLDGLQLINHWDTAFELYNETGNIAAFCPVLEKSGVNQAIIKHLRSAAFFEQTHRTKEAKREVQAFLGLTNKNQADLPAVFKLFLSKLKIQLNWINNNSWQQRNQLALQALKNGNYLRASLFGYEAFVRRLIEHLNIAEQRYEERERIMRAFRDRKENKEIKNHYLSLNRIRNAVAHGFIEVNNKHYRQQTEQILASESSLKAALKEHINFLAKVTL